MCASRECDDVNSYTSRLLSCRVWRCTSFWTVTFFYSIWKRNNNSYRYYRAAFRLDCVVYIRWYSLICECSTADFSTLSSIHNQHRINTCRCAPTFLYHRENSLTFIIKRVFSIVFFLCFSYCQRDSLCILDTHDQQIELCLTVEFDIFIRLIKMKSITFGYLERLIYTRSIDFQGRCDGWYIEENIKRILVVWQQPLVGDSTFVRFFWFI